MKQNESGCHFTYESLQRHNCSSSFKTRLLSPAHSEFLLATNIWGSAWRLRLCLFYQATLIAIRRIATKTFDKI